MNSDENKTGLQDETNSRFKSSKIVGQNLELDIGVRQSIESFVQENAFNSNNQQEITYNSFDRKKNSQVIQDIHFTSHDSGVNHKIASPSYQQQTDKEIAIVLKPTSKLPLTPQNRVRDDRIAPANSAKLEHYPKIVDPDAKDQHDKSDVSLKTKNESNNELKEFEAKLEERFYGVFFVNEQKHLFSINSLHCMTQHNVIRKICVTVVVNKWFDAFITFCILVNSCLLASKEYDSNYNSNYVSMWNNFLDSIDIVFTIIFLIECILKIMAMGFARHKKAYLRDAWNCIDFFIVLSSLVTLTPFSSESSFKVFRTARVLRPLRSMHQLKSMRSLLTTFFASIPGLLNVCLFQTFIFTIFAIIGVILFQGKHYQFCRATEEPLQDGTWPKQESANWQCSTDDMCSGSPNDLGDSTLGKCGDIYRDYERDPVLYDGSHQEEKINYDITNFNNVLSASVTIFQVITLEGWTHLMYNYQDTSGPAVASIFFVLVMLIGAFISLNLILASIMNSYLQQQALESERLQKEIDQMHKKESEQNSLASEEKDVEEQKMVDLQVTDGLNSDSKIQNGNLHATTKSLGSTSKEPLALNGTVEIGYNKISSQGFIMQNKNQGDVSAALDHMEGSEKQDENFLPNIRGQTATRFFNAKQIQDAEKNYEMELKHSQRSESTSVQNQQDDQHKTHKKGDSTFLLLDHSQSLVQSAQPGNQQNSHVSDPVQPEMKEAEAEVKVSDQDEIDQAMFGEVHKIGEMTQIQSTNKNPENIFKRHTTALQTQLIEEGIQDAIAETRSHKNCCYRSFYKLVTSVTFNFLIYCFIMANTITLALYRYNQSDEQERILKICDIVFVWVFTAELIAKVIGLGLKVYIQDKFNSFDAVIVVISLVDFTLQSSIDLEEAAGLLSAMRALRLLRVVKLARHWKAFQQILQALINSMVDISSFSVLLFLFLFIFALLGMEIFAYSVFFDAEGEAVFGQTNIQEAFERGDTMTWPRENFNNVFSSLLTVFIVVVAEDWNQVMYLYVRALSEDGSFGRNLAQLYFICLFVLGNTIMLALFTALLLKSQDEDIEALTEKMAAIETEKLSKKLSQSSRIVQEPSNPCIKIKNSCSRDKCLNKYNSIADSFVFIFGGRHALDQRKKSQKAKRLAKDGSSNKIADFQSNDQSIIDEVFQENNHKENEENNFDNLAQTVNIDFSTFVQADVIEEKLWNPLQRPVALLHYDNDQAIIVGQRAKKIHQEVERFGNSLFIFGPDNCFRKICDAVSSHRFFEYFIIICILVSTINLAFEHPMDDPNSQRRMILERIDYVFTGIFCVEALIKIITVGFLFNNKDSYLLNAWNVLDFCIVVLSLVSLTIDAKLSVVKVLRTARIIRPLRLIQHAEGLKVAIQALVKAIPQIMRLQFVVFFFMFMISILFTSLLSGKMFKCDMGHTDLSFSQQGKLIKHKWDCLNYGGIWRDADLNYDNTLQGMMSLFIFQTLEGWIILMYDSVDAVDVNFLGSRDQNSLYIFLYLILVIVLALLFTNMFVSIVIQTYNMEKDFLSFNRLLTEEQKSWIQVQIMTYQAKPTEILLVKSTTFVRLTAIKISQSHLFEKAIIFCIILNTVVMAVIWFDMDESISNVTDVINQIFILIFTFEAIIKIVAMKRLYFKDSWNIFDFTIVVSTLLIILLNSLNVNIPFGEGPFILRALRIGRILRLIKQAQQLQIIFNTLVNSAASQGSLGLLLIMSFFMFAIIGRSLFGLVKIGGPNVELNEHANFRDFSTSFLLLLRCATGENWHLIMFEIARPYAPDYQCRDGEDYESMMANGGEPFACGSPLASYIFFILFNIFVFQIYINLFVAIMIDAFLGQSQEMNLPVQPYQISEFVRIWSQYDPDATGFIAIEDLDGLIKALASSKESQNLVILHEQMANDDSVRHRFLAYLNVPCYDQFKKVLFYDVLQQLTYRVNLVNFNKDEIHEKHLEQVGLRVFGKGMDDLAIIKEIQSASAEEFNKSVRRMGRLNSKIMLMLQLQKYLRDVHDKYAIYVDTTETISMSEKSRQSKKLGELVKLLSIKKRSKDDINIYTTKHYFYGKIILKHMRALELRMVSRRSSLRNSPSPDAKISPTLKEEILKARTSQPRWEENSLLQQSSELLNISSKPLD